MKLEGESSFLQFQQWNNFYICYCISISWAFQVTQVVNPLANAGGTRDAFLSWEDSLEQKMATHPSILAQKIPWTEESGRLQVHGAAKSQTKLSTNKKYQLFESRLKKKKSPGSETLICHAQIIWSLLNSKGKKRQPAFRPSAFLINFDLSYFSICSLHIHFIHWRCRKFHKKSYQHKNDFLKKVQQPLYRSNMTCSSH